MAIRYPHVADELRRMIAAGEFIADAQLPNEDELSVKFGVGVPTLRRALDVLQDEGLIEKQHGRGNFVRRPRQRVTYTGNRGRSAGSIAASGLHVVSISARKIEADDAHAALLNVAAGSVLAEYVYLGEQDGVPRSLARIYVPFQGDLDRASMHWSPWDGDSAERAGALGAEGATTVVERVSSRLPTPNEVVTLRLTPRTSVLVIERTTADASGRVVEAALLALPGDAEAVFATELLDQLEDES